MVPATNMTIHAPDPALEEKAFAALVEAVVQTNAHGAVCQALVSRAIAAVKDEGDSAYAHRLQDLALQIQRAASLKLRLRAERIMAAAPAFGPTDFGIDIFTVLQGMGSEVTR